MRRLVVALAFGFALALMSAGVRGAPKRQKRAYKPAQEQQPDADAQPGKAAADADTTAPDATYEQELQAARDKRDKDIEDASNAGTDRATLEKRKQEIMAQYAAILAKMRDKYEAAHANDPAPADANAKTGKGKVGRTKPAEPEVMPDEPSKQGKSKDRNKKTRDTSDALADAQAKLDEENTRHQSKLDELNDQLKTADSSNNTRDFRRLQKSIEKENNTYSARKAILERRVIDLGGKPTPPPAPTPAPKADETPVSPAKTN
jgi:hypothetical protein